MLSEDVVGPQMALSFQSGYWGQHWYLGYPEGLAARINETIARRETSKATGGGSKASTNGAGALGFRDFPGLLAAKENRTGSRQTLLSFLTFIELRSVVLILPARAT